MGGGSASSTRVADGVYVCRGIIKGLKVEYNTSMVENSQYTDDIALRLSVEQEGLDWDKELYIGGNFKWEGTPQGGKMASGLGSAFRVARVFDVTGVEGEFSEDGKLDPQAARQLVGKEIFFLQYVRGLNKEGKPAYSDYKLIEARKGDEEEEAVVQQRLLEMFNADLSGGFIKNYKPDVLVKEEDFSFPPADEVVVGASTNNGWD